MKTILIIVFLIGIGNHFKSDISRFFSAGAFDANGEPQILLFTQQGCGASCDSARNFLDARGLTYQEMDPAVNLETWKEYGSPNRVPFLVVGYDRVNAFNPGSYNSLLAMNFGDSVLTSTEKKIYNQHFDQSGKPQLVLYGTDWCGYCEKLRDDFDDNSVSFLDIDVEKPNKKVWLLNAMGIYGYPVVYFGYQRIYASKYEQVMAAVNL